jgi:hypothetical protein
MNTTPTLTPPMLKIMAKYPSMDTSGVNNMPTVLDRLCKESYREVIAKGKEL